MKVITFKLVTDKNRLPDCAFFRCLLQELINTLLSVDQSKRITASEALKHPWIVVCKNALTGLFLLTFWTDQRAFFF